jgi:hypothetical protein
LAALSEVVFVVFKVPSGVCPSAELSEVVFGASKLLSHASTLAAISEVVFGGVEVTSPAFDPEFSNLRSHLISAATCSFRDLTCSGVQGFPSFCLHDKVPSGESKLKVFILAKPGCSALFSPILLAKLLTISSVQGLLSRPMHFKAPTDPSSMAALWEGEFVLRSVLSRSRCLAAISEGEFIFRSVFSCSRSLAAIWAFVFVVGFVVGCVVGFVVVRDAGVDVFCPIICKAAAKPSTTVAIMICFIGVFLLYPSVFRR